MSENLNNGMVVFARNLVGLALLTGLIAAAQEPDIMEPALAYALAVIGTWIAFAVWRGI